MIIVEDGWAIRFHRARKTWLCASRDGLDCHGKIAPGDRYAEVRRARLAQRSFGKRYCLGCAEALLAPPREVTLILTPGGRTAKAEHLVERVDGEATDA